MTPQRRVYPVGHPTHFCCGHEREGNTIKGGSRGQCRVCAIARKPFRCGHPTTPENTRMAGRYRKCRICERTPQTLHFELVPEPVPSTVTIQLFDPRQFAPRALPVVDTSGRSYGLAPKRRVG